MLRLKLPTRWLAAGLCFGALATGEAPGQTGDPILEHSLDPSAVVLELTEAIEGIRDEDPGPALRVFGDGLVRVHYPRYMKRAGDYTLQLSPPELRRLLLEVVDEPLLDFDEGDARRRRREALRQRAAEARAGMRGRLQVATDPSALELRIRLRRFRGADAAGPERADIDKRIRWRGLRASASRFPELRDLQPLARAHERLRELMRRGDLRKVESSP